MRSERVKEMTKKLNKLILKKQMQSQLVVMKNEFTTRKKEVKVRYSRRDRCKIYSEKTFLFLVAYSLLLPCSRDNIPSLSLVPMAIRQPVN